MVERPDGAFTEFVRTQQPRLLRTAYLLAGGHASAEDLLQTALLKTWTTVPADLGETSQAFRDDLDTCTSTAQMSIPSPAPAN